ncbi:MAG: serine hydrolase [Flavobacteriaceae bacterium]|nr:serine hydrolase [Flavobacteriaceae bacterium]
MKHFYFPKLLLVLCLFLVSCGKDEDKEEVPSNPVPTSMYFPPSSGDWETLTIADMQWEDAAVQPLQDFLSNTNTKSFMVLVNGRIVMESYFDGHTANDSWRWNSAGKTLVTAITGIAQQNNLLDIHNKVSYYLGNNWTSMPLAKEDLVTPFHLLTMSSGMADDTNLVTKANMTYVADAGDRWSYHNVFQKLFDVVASASNQDYKDYFKTGLENKIGMNGYWDFGPVFKIYFSDTRSMARFGLLALNGGKWEENQVVDADYFAASIQSSQSINPAYGYMWWLNGKSRYMLPKSQEEFKDKIVPNAPDDMYAAMGAHEQRIYVVPSKNMVVVRMGQAAQTSETHFALSSFDNLLWEKLNALIN